MVQSRRRPEVETFVQPNMIDHLGDYLFEFLLVTWAGITLKIIGLVH